MSKKQKKSGMACPVCMDDNKNIDLVPTGKIFMTNPEKRLYKCPTCGYKEIIEGTTKRD
jgi:DNA-directed RNA polymerase subunit RPC12/RpoP